MRLKIDTSDNLKTAVSLDESKLIKAYASPSQQDVLGAIDELLRREKKNLKDITEIEVNWGPGAFTSLRVGISVAKALGWAGKIPVLDKS